jgi:hypothetical protein
MTTNSNTFPRRLPFDPRNPHQVHVPVSFFYPYTDCVSQGKVHNPTGEGVRAVSAQVQAKVLKHSHSSANGSSTGNPDAPPVPSVVVSDDHETRTKEGTAKRNITRKKTDPRDTGNYDSRNKKQGGHGKGQWKDDIIFDDEVEPLNEKDPLFDETKELPYVLSSHEDPHSRNFDPTEGRLIVGPMFTETEFKLQVQGILQEYFDSCDSDEVIRSIEELHCKEYHPDVVKKAISISLDRHPRERELISRLLTCLHPSPLKDRDMEEGFDILLDSLDDLTMDVPEARVSLGLQAGLCGTFCAID